LFGGCVATGICRVKHDLNFAITVRIVDGDESDWNGCVITINCNDGARLFRAAAVAVICCCCDAFVLIVWFNVRPLNVMIMRRTVEVLTDFGAIRAELTSRVAGVVTMAVSIILCNCTT